MTITISIQDETASDLFAALQGAQNPVQESPMPDLTAIEERLAALENRKIWWANSGNASERSTSVPLTKVSPFPRRVVFSIALPDLNPGDLIDARATYEVTNDLDHNVMSGQMLLLCDSATATTGVEINEADTENVTENMHHQRVSAFGTLLVAEPMTGKFVNCVAFAGHTQAAAGEVLIIEQDYGRLEVKVFPSSMVEIAS